MIIADPSYDTVFKFLMEDTEIARALISEIIGEQVLSLTLAPQESALVVKPFGISLYRVDFKAVVKDAKGEQRKVLIEMQKAKHLIDIMRFRRYLGDNYTRTDTVDGVEQVLPITTIYFLGFNLSIERPVLRINRVYTDVRTGETLVGAKDDFIDKLTHDSLIVQMEILTPNYRTKLDRLLSPFSHKWQRDQQNQWSILYTPDMDVSSDPDLERIIKRLGSAALDENLRAQAQAEDDIERIILQRFRVKDEAIEKHIETIQEKNQALEAKDIALEANAREMAALRAEIERLKDSA